MAAAPVGGGSGRGLTAINITPMVDIMLVLLVVFMVASTALQSSDGMTVDRPDAATSEGIDPRHGDLRVACDRQGRVAVDGELARDDADLRAAIERRVAGAPGGVRAVVACDTASSVGALVHLLDVLRAAGVTQYAIATESPDAAAERT